MTQFELHQAKTSHKFDVYILMHFRLIFDLEKIKKKIYLTNSPNLTPKKEVYPKSGFELLIYNVSPLYHMIL